LNQIRWNAKAMEEKLGASDGPHPNGATTLPRQNHRRI
jgi:hypothetical protein